MADTAAVVGNSKQETGKSKSFNLACRICRTSHSGSWVNPEVVLAAGVAILCEVQHQLTIFTSSLNGVLGEYFADVSASCVCIRLDVQISEGILTKIGYACSTNVWKFRIIQSNNTIQRCGESQGTGLCAGGERIPGNVLLAEAQAGVDDGGWGD